MSATRTTGNTGTHRPRPGSVRLLAFLAGCLALALCLAACTSADDSWDRVRDAGVLYVGMDAGFPPFEFVAADGTLAGFDVDLARELGRRLGVDVQFVANLPYDGLYDALAVGRVHVVISALVVNSARTRDYAYSSTYFDAGQVLVAREGWAGIGDVADLDGRRLAVEFGSRGDLEARTWARLAPGLAIVPYETAAAALMGLAEDEVDVALVDHVSALAFTAVEGGLVVAGDPLVGEPYAVGMRREGRRLLRMIDEALAAMAADGTMERLVDEWLVGEGG